MRLIWREPGFDYSMKSIMQFQTEETGECCVKHLKWTAGHVLRILPETLRSIRLLRGI